MRSLTTAIFGMLVLIVMLIAILIVTPAAEAQWYIGGNAGVAFQADSEVTDSVAAGSITADAEFDTGFALGGNIGFQWGNWRAEGELSYRENDIDSLTFTSVTGPGGTLAGALGPFKVDGKTTALGFMANVFYTLATGTTVAPFIGGGIGAAVLGLDVETVGGFATPFDETDTVFAYQVAGGLTFHVNSHSEIDVSYRYYATEDPSFSNGVATVDAEYGSHNVMVGYRYRF